jgi:hypothetical protein
VQIFRRRIKQTVGAFNPEISERVSLINMTGTAGSTPSGWVVAAMQRFEIGSAYRLMRVAIEAKIVV